ncbi:MAG: ABC transporter substrate-binding protein, partial [Oscillospiraceae bacterium]|nr:ABC transporter substrate-binding protein [Oscillospiraceae bacterium]
MKGHKLFALLLALVMCMSLFAACGGGSDAETDTEAGGDTVKIGFIGPLTGSTAQYGIAVRNGAEQQIAEINAAGGVNGQTLELVAMDSEGDPTTATNAYTLLVDQEGVCAIVGPVLTGETLAVAELAAEDGIPCITASATGDDITSIGDTLFRTCFKDSFQGTKMADYAAEVCGFSSVAILYNNADEYSVGLAEAF